METNNNNHNWDEYRRLVMEGLSHLRSDVIALTHRVDAKADTLLNKLEESSRDSRNLLDSQTAEIKKEIKVLEDKRIRPLELDMAKIKGRASGAAALISFIVSLAGIVISYFAGKP